MTNLALASPSSQCISRSKRCSRRPRSKRKARGVGLVRDVLTTYRRRIPRPRSARPAAHFRPSRAGSTPLRHRKRPRARRAQWPGAPLNLVFTAPLASRNDRALGERRADRKRDRRGALRYMYSRRSTAGAARERGISSVGGWTMRKSAKSLHFFGGLRSDLPVTCCSVHVHVHVCTHALTSS